MRFAFLVLKRLPVTEMTDKDISLSLLIKSYLYFLHFKSKNIHTLLNVTLHS